MRALFRQNRMVSSIGGDFDHKSCWEILTDDELAAHAASRAAERRCSAATCCGRGSCRPRARTPAATAAATCRSSSRTHREELVLKPNRGYGGTGIRIGALTPQSRVGARVLDEALAQHDDPDDIVGRAVR